MWIAALALSVSAQAPSVDLSQARARYDAVAYDEALAILEGTNASTGEDKARVAAFIGVVRAQMGDDVAARDAFARAASLDACVAFPEVEAPAHVREMFASAMKRPPPIPLALPTGGASASTPSSSTPAASKAPTWPVPAGIAFAAAGGVTLAAAAVMGSVALSNNAAAQEAPVQVDAVAFDAAAREQALVANSLAVVGGTLVAGGVATAGLGLLLE